MGRGFVGPRGWGAVAGQQGGDHARSERKRDADRIFDLQLSCLRTGLGVDAVDFAAEKAKRVQFMDQVDQHRSAAGPAGTPVDVEVVVGLFQGPQ